jgi:intracellular septation protein
VTPAQKAQLRTLFLGGLLPVIAYTVIEIYYGTVAGLCAGMAFGIFEMAYEKVKLGKIQSSTAIMNGILLLLGGVSLFSSEGFWFKLQPALMEFGMGAIMIGSVLIGAPVLVGLAMKQGVIEKIPPEIQPRFFRGLIGMTWRLGLFLWIHAALATWAALYASTAVWAVLKGVGFTVSFIVYLLAETVFLRYRIRHPWKSFS